MKNIGYVRCSTTKQENSVETQTKLITDFCNTHDIKLDKIIVDEGISGKTQNRDGIKELMDLVKQNKVSNLIVLSLSRFGRSFIDNYKSIEIMKKHKTNFISLKENINLNEPIGVFIFQIFSSIYQLEISQLSQRTSDTLQMKKENNKVYSKVPYGKNRVGDDLVENKKETRMLRKMFRLKDKGFNYGDICRYLTKNRKKTKSGKKWTPQNVYSVMKSHLNSGKITPSFC
ncbi:MAG TPA: recombinase family protein [Candidatus Marinimicrobia bacterium]|nr:recombinase family protein [Candidatus Neomarinimicrobiota bacterium]